MIEEEWLDDNHKTEWKTTPNKERRAALLHGGAWGYKNETVKKLEEVYADTMVDEFARLLESDNLFFDITGEDFHA